MADAPLHHPLPGFFERLVLAWVAYFRVLFDAAYAARVRAASEPAPALPEASTPAPAPKKALGGDDAAERDRARHATDGALQLLALLQREGRLVDFFEEDITTFPDADVGAAARVVHEGCKKALHAHATLGPVRSEAEGARLTVTEAETQSGAVKLTGNVSGKPPFDGALRHRGVRVSGLRVPVLAAGHDPEVVAPAEVEL